MGDSPLFNPNPRWPDVLKDRRIYPFSTQIPVRFQDLDPNHHVNNVAVVAMFEEARYRFGVVVREQEFSPIYGIVTAAQELHYVAESFHGPPLSFHIGVGYIGSRSWRLWAAGYQNEKCVALCDSTLAMGRMPAGETAMPDALRKLLSSMRIKPDAAACG